VRSEQGRLDEAVACYQRALTLRPECADAHYHLGIHYLHAGNLDEAERAWRTGLRHVPGHAHMLAALTTLLGGKLPAEDVATLRQRVADGDLTDSQRSALHFGLAHVLDAQGEYGAAAEHLRHANSLSLSDRQNRGLVYDPADHERFVDALIETFSPAYFDRVRGWGVESEKPVFIVGLLRSGTTLTEQILAGHSLVFGAGELPLVNAAFESLPQVTKREALAVECASFLDRKIIERLARNYLDRLQTLDKQALRVVDKMPGNYLYLGFLATLFPRAKFIHCRRDLRDVASSCWMTDFRDILWANHPEHIASRIRAHERLMEHWRRVLPVRLLEVDYEETVTDLEGTARRLVDWCGLAWEPGCLAFHKRRQLVRTASAMQVRQPIYRNAVGRWKHYEQALAPLFALL
jgi:tetratricopeptide (TPR) repeat protein